MSYGKVVSLRFAHENYVGLLLKGVKFAGVGYRKATEAELAEACNKVEESKKAITPGTCYNLEAVIR